MSDEKVFFERGETTVTSARFIVGAQTFAMQGITSVQGIETPPGYALPAIMVVIGVGAGLSGLGRSVGLVAFGVAFSAFGVLVGFLRKSTYAVVLRTAGGEVVACRSKDRGYMLQVIQALNDAIVSRG